MRLTQEEKELIRQLRAANPSSKVPSYEKGRLGERIADKVTACIGSWPFLIVQTILLLFWVGLNVTAYVERWDPYPFILLNLMLSFQSAYTAPILLMSQARETAIDREKLQYSFAVNQKSELEIELLHEKTDRLMQHLGIEPNSLPGADTGNMKGN